MANRKTAGTEAEPKSTTTAEPRNGKLTRVLALLQAEGGATLAELVAATGWQPHTTRAVLSGLKKKGHLLVREKADGVSRYRIVQAVAQ